MDAYLFMRLLESRMRIVTNQATNQLMRDPLKLHPLARRMGPPGRRTRCRPEAPRGL